MSIKKKFNLVLGTAQLDNSYSFSKKGLSKTHFKKIIKLANIKKNFYIDTALAYKNSEKILSSVNVKKFKIITKINNLNTENIEKLIKSKKKLNIKKFYGVLFHDEKVLLKKTPDEFKEIFENIKKNKISDNIGVSVYTLKALKDIIKKFRINIVQVPVNIFDRRFLNENLLKKLKKKKIQIFVRSIFLKGLLINKKLRYNKRLNVNFKKEFDNYENWLVKENIANTKSFCINFVLKNNLNNMVIGFDNFHEYKEISNYKNTNYIIPPRFVKDQSDNSRLIRPDLW